MNAINPAIEKKAINVAFSVNPRIEAAVEEVCRKVCSADACFVLLFFSDTYDTGRLCKAIRGKISAVPVFGCTGAGMISSAGYLDSGLVAVSFSKRNFEIALCRKYDVEDFADRESISDFESGPKHFALKPPKLRGGNVFGLMIVDGLCKYEEPLAYHLASILGDIPLVGGSSGDDLHFASTEVLYDSKAHSRCAVLALIRTTLPFYPFSHHNFIPSEKVFVVTKADPLSRIIYELNGKPAAEEYSKAIGIPPGDMDSRVFANFPLVVRYRDECYVRSIQRIDDSGGMVFFCAIDEGLVMRLSSKTDLRGRTTRLFDEIRANIGSPQSVLTFDCIYTKIALQESPENYRFHERIFAENRCVGFNTFGEQFNSAHLNQTITGIAFGSSDER